MNDGGSVFFAMVFICTKIKLILSVCVALITINDNLCYFIIIFFQGSGSSYSKILVYCLLVVLSAICVCCVG